jgi:hypothetical protein
MVFQGEERRAGAISRMIQWASQAQGREAGAIKTRPYKDQGRNMVWEAQILYHVVAEAAELARHAFAKRCGRWGHLFAHNRAADLGNGRCYAAA